MKKFFTIIAILTTLVPIAAHAASKQATVQRQQPQVVDETPCGIVQTPAKLRITESTPGYRLVKVSLNLNVPDGVKAIPNGLTFAIALKTASSDIRMDSLGATTWVSRCDHDVIRDRRVYKAGTTWIKIRTAVDADDVWEDKTGLTVRAVLWLPESVITEQPVVYTTLRDNARYVGTWGKTEKGAVTLALSSD